MQLQNLIKEHSFNDRINKVSEKLNNIQKGIEFERYSKLDLCEQKLDQLEQEFNQAQTSLLSQLGFLKNNVLQVTKSYQNDLTNQNQTKDQQIQQIKFIEQKFNEAIYQEGQNIEKARNLLERRVEENVTNIRADLHREAAQRQESVITLKQSLENDLPRIQQSIQQEFIERENVDQQTMNTIKNELSTMDILNEKQQRETSEKQIFNMLKDIQDRFNRELSQEQKSRLETEDYILTLLEEASGKLNIAANF